MPVVAKAIPVAMAWCERELQTHKYFRELVGFAEAARVPVADLLLESIVYELSAAFKIPSFGCARGPGKPADSPGHGLGHARGCRAGST